VLTVGGPLGAQKQFGRLDGPAACQTLFLVI
jgi:hypothetical protein